MYRALDMELLIVRTVLKNETCEVSVCKDQKRDSSEFYTLVSVSEDAMRRELARRTAQGTLFAENSDFIGSFTFQNCLNLVFSYREENRLAGREEEYCKSFADRRKLSVSLLAACVEMGSPDDIGRLLLSEENINVAPGGDIYFNYFLDFSRFKRETSSAGFFLAAGTQVYEILSGGYRAKTDGDYERYPRELQLFYRKMRANGFTSLSQLLTFVRDLPDEPEEAYTGARRLLKWLGRLKSFYLAHTTEIFLALLVALTLFYVVGQLLARMGKEREKTGVYSGIEQIGDVYLGDENV